MHDLIEDGSQFIIATHSPILMAYPDACIYHFGAAGISQLAYEDTEHFRVTRDFLLDPQRMIKVLGKRGASPSNASPRPSLTSQLESNRTTPMAINLDAARALRDGGIDAVAALNAALVEVLAALPLDQHDHAKREIGKAMAFVLERTVEPAVHAHPLLEPDEMTWAAVARRKAATRAGT